MNSQTPKSKLKYELLNSNFGKKKKNRFKSGSRLNIQTTGFTKKKSRVNTPQNKQPAFSNRKIDLVYEKSKRSIRQIYSNIKDYDSFQENPKNLLEIRKKLNMTGGYSEALASGKLKNYNTNNSNQERPNLNAKSKYMSDLNIKFTPGTFLKNQKETNQQIRTHVNWHR